MRKGDTKGPGDKFKSILTLAFASPEYPLKLSFLNFASSFFFSWDEKLPRDVLEQSFQQTLQIILKQSFQLKKKAEIKFTFYTNTM